MHRTVTAHLDLVLSRRTRMIFNVAAAHGTPFASESMTVTVDGEPYDQTEVGDLDGGRLHEVFADGGRVVCDYEAEIEGLAPRPVVREIDLITYLRPSRYCESDTLGPTASSEFGRLRGHTLLDAVASWVSEQLIYVTGSSRPTDGAVSTLLARQGVCRDYAHLCIALLRAMNVPARLVAVYAPGLVPMEFHAVAEAYVDGAWYVVDATRLAPRHSMLRIATGRDAADTAFLTNHWAGLTLAGLWVTANVDELPDDDGTGRVQLR